MEFRPHRRKVSGYPLSSLECDKEIEMYGYSCDGRVVGTPQHLLDEQPIFGGISTQTELTGGTHQALHIGNQFTFWLFAIPDLLRPTHILSSVLNRSAASARTSNSRQ